MSHLIVYYSRTGKNKKIAEIIKEKTGGDIEEIVDLKNRNGFIGWLNSGKDALFKKLTRIKEQVNEPSKYDFLVLGTPVWIPGNITPALRTYLINNKNKIKNYFLFSVSGLGEKNRKISKAIESILERKPIAELYISEKEIKKNTFMNKLNDFVKKIAQF